MRLGDIYKISKGKKAPDFNEAFFDGAVRFIQIDDLRNDDNVKYCQDDSKLVKCKADDILIAWDGANAGTIGYGLTGIIGSTLAKLVTTRNDVYTPYVGYFLKSKFKYLRDRCTGATIPHISKQVLTDLEIPLPPLEEQKRIAQVLDKADRLRQKDRQLLAHYDQLLQSVFLDMFGATNPDSAYWEEVRIKDIAAAQKGSMRTGPFGSDLLHSEFVDEGIFVLGIDNVVNNTFEWGKARFITEQKYEKLKRYKVYPGDVLVSIMATTGRTAVVPDDMPEAINSKHLAAITLNREVADPTFISYSLHSDPKVVFQLTAQNRGAIMNGLNLGIIKETKINLPPLSLQKQFAEITQSINYQKAVIEKTITTSEALFQSLLQKAFKGELQLKDDKVVEQPVAKPKFVISSIL